MPELRWLTRLALNAMQEVQGREHGVNRPGIAGDSFSQAFVVAPAPAAAVGLPRVG